MGGSQSVGYLHLQLENRNLQAGQEITGVIHFKLDQNISAGILCLKLRGKEFCQWTETRTERDRDGRDHTVSETYRGHSQVVRQKFPIYPFPGGVLAGQYSFPFVFRLPANIPGSFAAEEGSTKAHIHYNLVALIDGQSAHIEKAKVPIHISQLMTDPIYSVADDVTANISTWCCSSKGSIQIKAYFNKNAYAPGELAEFMAEINNAQSQLDVLRLRGTLYRTLRLRSNTGRTHVTKSTVVSRQCEQRVPSGSALLGEQCVRMQLPIQDPTGQLQQATSVRGNLIECVYSINVFADMDGSCMCCGQTPQVERYMIIYPVQLPIIQPPMVPPNWNPQVMQMAQFNLGQNYEYQPSAPPLQ